MTTVDLRVCSDHIFKRTICDCTSNECDVDTTISIDDGITTLAFYMDMKANDYDDWERSWIQRLRWRLKSATRLLFKGRLEMNHEIVFNEKSLIEFRKSLEESIAVLEEYKKSKAG